MPDEKDIDWSLTTFEGNRRLQHQEFHRLSFREKLMRIEEMGEIAANFAALRGAAGGAERENALPRAEESKEGGADADA